MAKLIRELQFDTQARKSLLKGINIVAEAVGSTLGPRGRNVAVDQYPDLDVPPTVLHDGVSVAKSINLQDKFEDMGARLVKGAALKTNEVAGDGTTTATILAQAIVNEANKLIEAGANPMQLKREIEDASDEIVDDLLMTAKEITTPKERKQVATISAADPEIGGFVTEALEKVGSDGVITIEEGKTVETTIDYKQGLEINRGYLSPYFVTNQETNEAVITDPYILITDKKINYHFQLIPLFDRLIREGKSKNLVIIASQVVEEALATCVLNKLNGKMNVVAITAPNFGINRIEELSDIAVATGGTPILQDSGREIEAVEVSELGRASKFIADVNRSVIIEGHGKEKDIMRRQREIRNQITLATNPYEKETKEQRLANISGNIAIINVGGMTEVEVREKKERFIDALSATRAAIDEGIVAGGEISLYYLGSQGSVSPQEGFSLGESILLSALKAPFKRLLANSGLDYAETLQKLSGKAYPFGIDVIDGKVKDLIKAGIIDPVKVTRTALENAVSIACMIITTNCLIADVTADKEQPL